MIGTAVKSGDDQFDQRPRICGVFLRPRAWMRGASVPRPCLVCRLCSYGSQRFSFPNPTLRSKSLLPRKW